MAAVARASAAGGAQDGISFSLWGSSRFSFPGSPTPQAEYGDWAYHTWETC